ncbi:polysaccharide biosynthesis tyrosine autokinase [Ornithinimicrobium sp. Y1847]|uniref:polysaccharide biosynthesis tyrosine autokinase n=1 Tax=Ornithinimicrobium sp. Y1847 TaxID=3405419 RepID=UPI003B66F2B9
MLAFLYTLTQPIVYQATSTALVQAGSSDTVGDAFSGGSLAQTRATTYTALANSMAVGEAMQAELGVDTPPAALAGAVTAWVVPNTSMIQVNATASTPQEAMDRANAAVRGIRDQAMALENAGRAEGQPMSSVIQVIPNESALLPGRPISPNYPRNLAGGTAAGLALGVGLGLIRRQLDRRVRTVGDVEQVMTSAVLGIIPESTELNRENRRAGGLEEQGAAAESLRQLRTNLRFVDVDNPPRSILITSANAGEGKSTLTANLARVLAHAGQRTIVVDGDLRRPTVAKTFGVDSAVGLTQVLAGDVELSDALQSSDDPNLDVLSAGRIPPNPSELLGSQRMQKVLADLIADDYLVLLDAPRSSP